ncbi:MAG TPA: hypothetical protein VHX37_13385 [Acidobacteriaceae bacterium]|jgi:hypothetical protein|nr:hypothetical protein [Acidobacteriaceae bacterium]
MAIGEPEVTCDVCGRSKPEAETWSVAVLDAWIASAWITFAASRDSWRDASGQLPNHLRFFDLCGEGCEITAHTRWHAGAFPEVKETGI